MGPTNFIIEISPWDYFFFTWQSIHVIHRQFFNHKSVFNKFRFPADDKHTNLFILLWKVDTFVFIWIILSTVIRIDMPMCIMIDIYDSLIDGCRNFN